MREKANDESLDLEIQRIVTEEYADALRSLVALLAPLEQRKEKIDRIERRIKTVKSIKDKMKQKGIGLGQLREQIRDIIGIRIVVHFLTDIPDTLSELSQLQQLELSLQTTEDYIATPKTTGYRSLHLNAIYKPEEGTSSVPCEIQIRTTLQHAWATKSHLLLYKIQELPERFQRHFRILSDQLHLADGVADLLRSELSP